MRCFCIAGQAAIVLALSVSTLVTPQVMAAQQGEVRSAETARARTNRPFVVIEELGAPGAIDTQKFADCLNHTVKELSLEDRELPKMVVYHISQQSAEYLGIDASSIYRDTGSGYMRYEMWIIGKPSHYAYSYLVVNLLQHHFQLTMNNQARSRLIGRLVRYLDKAVDVRSLR